MKRAIATMFCREVGMICPKPILMSGILIALAQPAIADWIPPANPDPVSIIREARGDTSAGRFEDALAKHVWYHQHALEYRPSLVGARLTSVLMSWHELGKAYPPALVKLKEVRDKSRKLITNGKKDVFDNFQDFEAINRELGEQDQTVELFVTLDRNSPKTAKVVYELAQPALVGAKKFVLCGKYLAPEKSVEEMLELYRLDLELADEQETLAGKRKKLNCLRRFCRSARRH